MPEHEQNDEHAIEEIFESWLSLPFHSLYLIFGNCALLPWFQLLRVPCSDIRYEDGTLVLHQRCEVEVFPPACACVPPLLSRFWVANVRDTLRGNVLDFEESFSEAIESLKVTSYEIESDCICEGLVELCSAVVLLQLLKDFFLVVGLQSEPYWRSFLQGIQEHVQFLIVKVEMLERPGWHQVKVVELCVVKWLQIAFPEQSLCVILEEFDIISLSSCFFEPEICSWGEFVLSFQVPSQRENQEELRVGNPNRIRIVFPLPRQKYWF